MMMSLADVAGSGRRGLCDASALAHSPEAHLARSKPKVTKFNSRIALCVGQFSLEAPPAAEIVQPTRRRTTTTTIDDF